jgi:hypothetical protein
MGAWATANEICRIKQTTGRNSFDKTLGLTNIVFRESARWKDKDAKVV